MLCYISVGMLCPMRWSSSAGFSSASVVVSQFRPRGYKTFSMLNSAGHEILTAHKCKNFKNFSFFLGSDEHIHVMLFSLLLNVEMPTIVGILTFMSRKKFMLN